LLHIENLVSKKKKHNNMFKTPYRETPGSVTLKSNIPMEYSRAVLTNIW